NGGTTVARLTSRGEAPYFPKLDSSFCQVGTHDSLLSTGCLAGIGLAPVARHGMGGAVMRMIKELGGAFAWSVGWEAVRRGNRFFLAENPRGGRLRGPRMGYMKDRE